MSQMKHEVDADCILFAQRMIAKGEIPGNPVNEALADPVFFYWLQCHPDVAQAVGIHLDGDDNNVPNES